MTTTSTPIASRFDRPRTPDATGHVRISTYLVGLVLLGVLAALWTPPAHADPAGEPSLLAAASRLDFGHRRGDRYRRSRPIGRIGFRAGIESTFNDDGEWQNPHGFAGLDLISQPSRFFGIGLLASYFRDDTYPVERGGHLEEVELNVVPLHLSFMAFLPLIDGYVEWYIGGGPTLWNYWITDPRGDHDDSVDEGGQKYGLHGRWGVNFVVTDNLEFFGEYGHTVLASDRFGRSGPQVSYGVRLRID